MAMSSIPEGLNNLKLSNSKDINILLLGETGVGKSTFINSIANYLHFEDFENAEQAGPVVLIPSVIVTYDENYEEKIIKIGKTDKNEYQEIGKSGTQYVKTYVFPIGGDKRLRLIDTPGVGDTRGIMKDKENYENILAYLNHLKELHGICVLLKPDDARITVLSEYCLKHILSRLEKSASKNIIFIFTNTRGKDYTGGFTLPCLKKQIDDIHKTLPSIQIPLKNNIFYYDNEAFCFLSAIHMGVEIDGKQRDNSMKSWNISLKESWKMINYIITLQPHKLEGTISINEARRLILQLCKPLADISETISDNIRIMERHRKELSQSDQTIDDLKKKLYMPVVNLELIQLDKPVTVCTAEKCTDTYQVGDVSKKHYRQRCHDPCYLPGIAKEMIGHPGLFFCWAMFFSTTCSVCGCSMFVHMHVYYLTKTVDDKIINKNVEANLNDENQIRFEAQKMITGIEERMKEYEEERKVITKILAKFTYFLQNNALTPYNDAYQKYIKYLIEREEHLGPYADQNQLKNLNQLLNQYEEEKIAFENALRLSNNIGNKAGSFELKPSDIMEYINQLYSLKHNGKKIRQLLECQKAARNSEYDNICEYIHPKNIVNPIKKMYKKYMGKE